MAGWGRAFGACCFAGKLRSPGGPGRRATVAEAVRFAQLIHRCGRVLGGPTFSIERAAELLGLSRSSAYRAAANGQFPTLVFRRRLFVPTVRLLEMLGFLIEEQP